MTSILVTNDDGIDSPGLRHLAALGAEWGDVIVAAPAVEASGSSAALTAIQEHGRVQTEKRTWDELPGVPVFAVQATPALIVLIAQAGGFGPAPDLVLSGINRGANTGQAVVHSGTVGAAVTAASHGCPAMAVSLASAAPVHWEAAVDAARQAYAKLDGGGVVLNVNAPDLPAGEWRGLTSARLASFGAVQIAVTDRTEGQLQLSVSDVNAPAEEGTDAALLAQGFATFTVLDPLCEEAHP